MSAKFDIHGTNADDVQTQDTTKHSEKTVREKICQSGIQGK